MRMKNIQKLVKSFVVTTVLSFGVISGGHFTEAAALDKTKTEPVKAVQANSPQNIHASEKAFPVTPVKPEVTAQLKAEAKPVVAAQAKEEAMPEVTAQPKAEAKAEIQLKKENRMVKSQASVHASETAKTNASQNSVIFSNSPAEELTGTDAITEYYY